MFFEQLGWCPPGTWCPTQTAAVLISSTVSFISHRPDRKGTLASDLKGAGAWAPLPPPPPCARHWLIERTCIIMNLQCTCVKLVCTTLQSAINPHPSKDSTSVLLFASMDQRGQRHGRTVKDHGRGQRKRSLHTWWRSCITVKQGWATLRVTRANIFSPFYQGARLLIHVHTPFTPFYSISFLLKEMKV